MSGRRTGHHGRDRCMTSKKHAENFVTEKIYRDELLELLLLMLQRRAVLV